MTSGGATVGAKKKGDVRRKSFLLDQVKIDQARICLGTKTDTETIEAALDLASFGRLLADGIEELARRGVVIEEVYPDGQLD